MFLVMNSQLHIDTTSELSIDLPNIGSMFQLSFFQTYLHYQLNTKVLDLCPKCLIIIF